MSNNGWPNDPIHMEDVGVPGVADTGKAAAGAVSELFRLFFQDFHNLVEPLVTINGYRSKALNTASGGIESSNHRSGTAFDLNGARHPYEPSAPKPYNDGFTDTQTATIRGLLNKYGVLKWGMDFPRGYRDAMHFEIIGSHVQVAASVARNTPEDDMSAAEVALIISKLNDISGAIGAGGGEDNPVEQSVLAIVRRVETSINTEVIPLLKELAVDLDAGNATADQVKKAVDVLNEIVWVGNAGTPKDLTLYQRTKRIDNKVNGTNV